MKEHCNTPSSTTRLTSCLHSILQCWLLSVSTHGKQSALQNGMGLACKTTQQHTHVSHSHAHTQTKWEQSTDKKIERNTVQRRMEGLLRKQQFSLEERREKWATIGMFNLLFLCTKYWIPIITNQFIAKFNHRSTEHIGELLWQESERGYHTHGLSRKTLSNLFPPPDYEPWCSPRRSSIWQRWLASRRQSWSDRLRWERGPRCFGRGEKLRGSPLLRRS